MATAAKKAQKARTAAPKAAPPTEAPVEPAPAPAPKPSIWTRVKSAAKKTASAIAKPFKAAASKIKPAAKSVASAARKVVRSERVRSAKGFATRLWQRGLRPFLRASAFVIGGSMLLFGAMVAPVPTFLALSGTGLFLIALSFVWARLEKAEAASQAARAVLRAFDVLAMFLLGFAYGFVALNLLSIVVATPASGLVFAVVVAWLYRINVPTETPIEAQEVPEYSEIRRKPEVHETVVRAPAPGQDLDDAVVRLAKERLRKGMPVRPSDAPGHPELWTRGEHLTAKGSEEMWGTEHDRPAVVQDEASVVSDETSWADTWENDTACVSCGSTKGAMRVRNEPTHLERGLIEEFREWAQRNGHETSPERAMLCSDCYGRQCEEDAVKFTGVSLEKKSCEVRLTQAGIEHSPEYAASKFDVTAVRWLASAWWRDKAGNHHEREWSCLHDGKVVATVVHDYKRKTYRAVALGKLVKGGVKTSLEAAKRVATDELFDDGNAVARLVEKLGEIADDAGQKLVPAARLVPKKA